MFFVESVGYFMMLNVNEYIHLLCFTYPLSARTQCGCDVIYVNKNHFLSRTKYCCQLLLTEIRCNLTIGFGYAIANEFHPNEVDKRSPGDTATNTKEHCMLTKKRMKKKSSRDAAVAGKIAMNVDIFSCFLIQLSNQKSVDEARRRFPKRKANSLIAKQSHRIKQICPLSTCLKTMAGSY